MELAWVQPVVRFPNDTVDVHFSEVGWRPVQLITFHALLLRLGLMLSAFGPRPICGADVVTNTSVS